MIFPRWMPRGLLRGLAGLLLPTFLAASAHADGAAVWSIKGEHNTVYLAGSVHALPREHAELSPQLERAYRAADDFFGRKLSAQSTISAGAPR